METLYCRTRHKNVQYFVFLPRNMPHGRAVPDNAHTRNDGRQDTAGTVPAGRVPHATRRR